MIHFPPKVILVPMDLLDPSFKALSQASLLAEAFGAQIEILHVLPAPAGSAPYYWDQTPDHKRRREAIAAIRRRLPTDAPIDVLEGDPVSAILHAAYLRRAGMIVMGSHGRSGWGRVLFGSTAEAVVRSSPVPVMVVRGVPGTIHSILAPLSFSPYALDAFRYAGKLAKTLDARLTALHAVSKGETPASVGRRMRHWLKRLPGSDHRGGAAGRRDRARRLGARRRRARRPPPRRLARRHFGNDRGAGPAPLAGADDRRAAREALERGGAR